MKLRSIALSLPALASYTAQATVLPPNNLYLQDNINFDSNINQSEFNQIIDSIILQYKPLAKLHGADLKSNNLWTDTTVNASAEQIGTTWQINMYGGLARRPEVTADGFAMVVCHELGHHFGGFAFYGATDWAASEGQSDYFATQACARKIWRDQKEANAKFRNTVGTFEKQKCDDAWKETENQNLCYRTAAAGNSLAALLAALNSDPVPQFDTPDTRTVKTTNTAHPDAQCRLDTYFNGGLCSIDFDELIIPGRFHVSGQTSAQAETESSKTSCMLATGRIAGNRPRCWYGPLLSFLGITSKSNQVIELAGNGNGSVEPGEEAQIIQTVGNSNQAETTNLEISLTSASNTVTIKNSKVTVPNIPPNETRKPDQPFTIQVSQEASCGARIPLTFVGTSNQGSVSWNQDLYLGKISNVTVGENKNPLDIPDKDTSGVVSTLVSQAIGTTIDAEVRVDIDHTYPMDLRIDLVSPGGLSKEIYPGSENSFSIAKAKALQKEKSKRNAAGVGIHDTFKASFPGAGASGTWKLKIRDVAATDVGKLIGWDLKINTAICE